MRDSHSITARAMRSLLWVSSSMGVLAVLRVLNLMILARLLGPGAFGLMSAAFVVVGLSYVISDMGVGYALIQRQATTEREFRNALSISMLTGIALYLLVWVASSEIAIFFNQPRLEGLLKGLALAFPLRSISVPVDALLQRDLNFGTVARVDVAAYVTGYFLVSIFLALLGYEIWALGGAFLAEAIVRTALLAWLSPYRMAPAWNPPVVRALVRFGTAVSLTRIANFIALQVDKIVVGRMLGTETLGAYERAYQLMVMPANLFGQVVGRVLFPAVSQIQDKRDSVRKNYQRALSLTALVTLPLSLMIVLLDYELVFVVLGPGWEQTVPALQILGSVLLFRTSYKISGEMVRACGAVYGEAWRQVAYAAAVLTAGMIGSNWGLVGVSLGVAVAITVNFLLMTDLGRRLAGLSWAQVIAAHRPALVMTVITGTACLAGERAAAGLGLGALATLTISLALATTAGLAALFLQPRWFGKESRWLIGALKAHAPPTIARLVPDPAQGRAPQQE